VASVKIYDTFLFNDELDLLRCRLEELDKSPVYRFVIVEANKDNQGHPKPLHFQEHRDEFAPWLDRITPVPVMDMPKLDKTKDRWPFASEYHMREATFRGLRTAQGDDLVLHGDVDEIPSLSGIQRARTWGGGIFRMRCAVFAVDWELPWRWDGIVGLPFRHITSFEAMRNHRFDQRASGRFLHYLPASGWHLTWLGGPEAIRAKLMNYCHLEMTDYILRGLETNQFYERGIFWGHGNGDTQLIPVDVDRTWPKYVYERRCPEIWFRPRGDA
jgi:Glycosyltransferase family 17